MLLLLLLHHLLLLLLRLLLLILVNNFSYSYSYSYYLRRSGVRARVDQREAGQVGGGDGADSDVSRDCRCEHGRDAFLGEYCKVGG